MANNKSLKEKAAKLLLKAVTAVLFPLPAVRRTVRRGLQTGGLVPDTFLRYFLRDDKKKQFRYYLSLTICIRNEAPYIAEWIEYHRFLGIDHFYVYDNESTDGVAEVLRPYVEEGLVTYTFVYGGGVQIKTYKDAVLRFRDETRWMGFIDCDEFLVLSRHRDMKAFMREYEKFSQVLLHWVLYGSSGQKCREPGLVIERFRSHADEVNRHSKAICNPRAVTCADVHVHRVLGRTTNETKVVVNPRHYYESTEPSARVVHINHYVIKSREEFYRKRARGVGTSATESGEQHYTDSFFDACDSNDVTDPPELMQPAVDFIYRRLNRGKEDPDQG